MTAIGWGKVILLGEHAVVYGYPALTAALDRGVRLSAVPTPAGGTLRCDVPEWNIKVIAPPAAGGDEPTLTARGDSDHPFARGLAAIADSLGIGRPPLTLVGEAQIPPGAGLGASAAFAVATARELLAWAKRAPDPTAVAHAAAASEEVLHGRASGVDVAIASAGGIGVFRKAGGLRALPKLSLRVLVGPSGAPKSTSQMVERVALSTGGKAGDPRLRELAKLTDSGTSFLLGGELAELGATMNRAHEVLADLGVSTPLLDGLCTAAREAGAYGAKLTGSGGGGSVIAIAPREREADVLAAWKVAAVTGFASVVGSR